MQTYTIKPLEWHDNSWNGLLAQPFGPFTYHITGCQYTVTRANVSGAAPWMTAESEEAAKAACQAMHESNLQSVLERIDPCKF